MWRAKIGLIINPPYLGNSARLEGKLNTYYYLDKITILMAVRSRYLVN